MFIKLRLGAVFVFIVVFTASVIQITSRTSDVLYLSIALFVDLIIILLFFPKILSNRQIDLSKLLRSNNKSIEKEITRRASFEVDLKKLNFKTKLSYANLVFLLLSSLAFAYFAIFKLHNIDGDNFILIKYYAALLNNINDYLLIFLMLLTPLFLITFRLIQKGKRVGKLLRSFFICFINLGFSSLVGLVLVIIFSASEISLFRLQIASNPKSAGIIVDQNTIIDELKKMANPPTILGKDKNIEDIIVLLKEKNKSTFYKNNIIPLAVRLSPIKSKLPSSSVMLLDNNLIITDFDKGKIESVSPVIAKLFVKNALAPRYIKDEPNVNLMDRQEYLKYRDDQINEAVQKIDDVLTQLQKGINILYSDISTDKKMISSNETSLSNSITERDEAYNYCMNAGYYSYYFGYFYRFYSDSDCNNQKAEWDTIIAGFQKNIQDWKNRLAYDQKQLADFQDTKDNVENYRVIVASQKDQAPYELGLFEPEKSVKVVLENTSTSSLADFYETLVHEYLHYTSYVSKDRKLDGFFEEGLTEYFARKVVKINLNTDTNLGYPLISKIIQEMIKKIPDDKLEEIYFTKNQDSLVSLLNESYGKNFYKDSQLYFTLIYYVPSKDAIKIANNIMFKIGGNELREDDLTSTRSSFN